MGYDLLVKSGRLGCCCFFVGFQGKWTTGDNVIFFGSLTLTLPMYGKLTIFYSPRGLIYGKVSDFPFPSAGTSFNCVLILVVVYIDF